jgi:multisubunit Na+/H+ antiporter MnhG subunit
MPVWMKATGIGGSVLAILALIIIFLKSIIAFVGFLTFAIKIIIVIVFVALFLAVGLMIFRTWNAKRKAAE